VISNFKSGPKGAVYKLSRERAYAIRIQNHTRPLFLVSLWQGPSVKWHSAIISFSNEALRN
jgi:hypothetical protein